MVRAFAVRAPFRDAALTLAGEGRSRANGRSAAFRHSIRPTAAFRGYRGIALREHAGGAVAEDATEVLADPDSLRELVHEIKTPLNAIIGFAEIIEGQYLGSPTVAIASGLRRSSARRGCC